jgi:quercetin dioxygenase-like cupin family protein
MTEIYKIPQGKLIISFCNENISIGLLELNPNQELQKHNRPVNEELVQIHGTSVMKLFDGDNMIKEITLKEGERLVIPANQFHIHSNKTENKSITLWKFEGNITEIIENIRNNFKKVNK